MKKKIAYTLIIILIIILSTCIAYKSGYNKAIISAQPIDDYSIAFGDEVHIYK